MEQSAHKSNFISQQLRDKLKRFLRQDTLVIQTRHGETIGDVKDLIPRSNLDEHFNLILSQKNSSHLYMLNSKYITKIDPKNRAILTVFENLDVIHLPQYKSLENGWEESLGEGLENMDNQLAAPVLVPNQMVEKQALSQQSIQLLEERLLVNRTRRKVGEIIVRKHIETRMVEVPVHREKLIIEQVGSSGKPLAEIDLGIGEVVGVDLATKDTLSAAIAVKGTFSSLTTVAQLLDVVEKTIHYKARKVMACLFLRHGELQETYHEFGTAGAAAMVLGAIANTLPTICRNVQVEVVLEDEEAQPIYQKWFDYYSNL